MPSSRAKVDIVCHDARDMVVSLLTDPRITDDDYLFFDNNPLAPPPEDLDYLGDINTGAAHIEMHKKLITDPEKEILVPVLLYIDGAVTGQFENLQIEALQMTLGIFNRKCRDKEYAWRTLGYVPSFKKESSRGKKILVQSKHVESRSVDRTLHEGEGEAQAIAKDDLSQGARNLQDMHFVLDVMLNSYGQMEQDNLGWSLAFRNKVYHDKVLRFFIMFIKCDMAEANKMCLSFNSNGLQVKNHCHYCVCPTMKNDDVTANYKLKTVPMLRKMYEKDDVEGLRNLSQHCIENIFHKFRFGLHNTRGVHGATPQEVLHAILLGLFGYMRDCFLEQIGPKSMQAEEMNALCQHYGEHFGRQSDRDLPNTNFGRGIFCGKLNGKEFEGVLLLMATVIRSTAGRKVLRKKQKYFGKDCQIRDWSLLVETCLQWEQYLKLDKMKRIHVQRLKKKHRYIMYLMKKVGRRIAGNGLKIPKFHAIVHLADDILMFGVPNNTDTGTNESHHKVTKVAAKMTQKNIDKFEIQTSQRLDEFHNIDLSMEEILNGCCLWDYFHHFHDYDSDDQCDTSNDSDQMSDDNSDNSDQVPKTETRGLTMCVYRDEETGNPAFTFPKSKRKKHLANAFISNVLVKFLLGVQDQLQEHVGELCIKTEHKRSHQIFRAHPFYREKPWYDWAIFDWAAWGKLPGHIACFIDLNGLQGQVRLRDGIRVYSGIFAVVESANYVQDAEENDLSELFLPISKDHENDSHGNWKSVYYLADVESIVDPCLVVPDIGNKDIGAYFVVQSRKNWEKLFIQWVNKPHDQDVMEDTDDEMDDTQWITEKEAKARARRALAPQKRAKKAEEAAKKANAMAKKADEAVKKGKEVKIRAAQERAKALAREEDSSSDEEDESDEEEETDVEDDKDVIGDDEDSDGDDE